MAPPALPRLIAITDDPALVRAAIDSLGDRLLVQLRAKQLEGRDLLRRARDLAELTPAFVVNDRLDVALAAGALGVHLPEDGLPIPDARALLGPDRLVGASRHDLPGVRAARTAGADYILFAPVWPTPSKPGHPGTGLTALTDACRAAAPTPVYALGGIDTPDRARAARAAGAHGIAGIRLFIGDGLDTLTL